MVKADKRKSVKYEVEEDESVPLDSKPVVELSGSDDEEANEDLSLKIIKKALMVKAAKLNDRNKSVSDDRDVAAMVDLVSSSSHDGQANMVGINGGDEEGRSDLKSDKIVKRKRKKTKTEKAIIIEDGDKTEMIESVETVEEAEMAKTVDAVENIDPNTVDITDNIVLRKLLRGPRYFDPPDNGWETCYKCGEEGHMAVNCRSATKRKKPCFVCGSFDHGAKQCSKAQDCFICQKSGHRAKDCPEKHKSGSKNGKICLRCGTSGHDMFSCRKDYSQDDLKEIQCYVCKDFGHLSCANFVDTSSIEVSCYRCGQLGHNGVSCGMLRGETKDTTDNGSPTLCYKCGEGGHFARECTFGTTPCSTCYNCGGEGHFARECTIGIASPGSCYKCGGEGHFARECTIGIASPGSCYKCGGDGHFARECSSSKVSKRSREPSTPNARPRKPKKSALFADDQGKSSKGKKTKHEEKSYSTPRKTKQRGGWITEDPEDFYHRNSKRNHWQEPEGEDFSYRKSKGNHWQEPEGEDFSYRKYKRNHWQEPEGEDFSYRKSKRNHWEEPGGEDFSHRKSKRNHWHSPSTPSKELHKKSSYGSSASKQKYPRTFSASRFGDNGNDNRRQTYWW